RNTAPRLSEAMRSTAQLVRPNVRASGTSLGVKTLRDATDAANVVIIDGILPPALLIGHVRRTPDDATRIEPDVDVRCPLQRPLILHLGGGGLRRTKVRVRPGWVRVERRGSAVHRDVIC